MIEQLYIENVALIEKTELSLGEGLNVLSGETGAGKTMIIDSINFLLGERSGRDFIRKSAEHATVSGIIRQEGGEENSLMLSRSLNAQGKSTCRIDGRVVTLGMLKEASASVADVHGQHEHQSLLNPGKHIVLLDRFCGARAEELKTRLGEYINRYKALTRALAERSGGRDREAQIELLSYQKDEIDSARLQPGEEEELQRRRAVMAAAEKLAESAGTAIDALYDGEAAALDNIYRAKTAAAEMSRHDPSQQELHDGLLSVHTQLTELVRDLRRYADGLRYDPRGIAEVDARLDLLYTLKRKYGQNRADATVEDVLAYGRTVTERLEFIQNSEEDIKRLAAQKRECTGEIQRACAELSRLRSEAAGEICSRITQALRELGMRHAEFEIAIERKQAFSQSGYDRVEFLISPNPGEGLKPLARIASGGEMSRLMLAIKTVLADADNIGTFIFDEIDAGVSGRTAQRVAEKLALLAKGHQILCITHLPQIAAMADRHFLIEKDSDGERTVTSVTELDAEASVAELARLLGGAKITESTMKAAKEMRELAIQLKQTIKGAGL